MSSGDRPRDADDAVPLLVVGGGAPAPNDAAHATAVADVYDGPSTSRPSSLLSVASRAMSRNPSSASTYSSSSTLPLLDGRSSPYADDSDDDGDDDDDDDDDDDGARTPDDVESGWTSSTLFSARESEKRLPVFPTARSALKWPRRNAVRKGPKIVLAGGKGLRPARGLSPRLASSSSSSSSSSPSSRRRRRSRWSPRRLFEAFVSRCLRPPFGPLGAFQPLTIFAALLFVSAFVTWVTLLIMYILNPDKERLPWRTYCQDRPPFPHDLADSLDPVSVFVGVLTVDAAFERRQLIRSTYVAHTRTLDPLTGRPSLGMQFKFIMGWPRKENAEKIALEMETYNDIAILDIKENMNGGKTHAFFKWAAENATVPYAEPVASSVVQPDDANSTDARPPVVTGWKKADFVVKADDDAFLVLDELERHLRVTPQKMTYWGYLIRDWFMAGETYALSSDLVQWIATAEETFANRKGKEDKVTAKWMTLHPNASDIHWVSEHCWIYDHPKAGTVYSHGFLFPDEVERVRLEGMMGLSEEEITRRGGEHAAASYSTVSKWHEKYVPPRPDLTMEEKVEALVEGGGRWAGTWVREGRATDDAWLPWNKVVHGAGLLKSGKKHPSFLPSSSSSSSSALASVDSRATGQPPSHPLSPSSSSSSSTRLVRPPTSKDEEETKLLWESRYLGRPHGGTVVIHFIKHTEWFLETAIALLGHRKTWSDGANSWRMWGSPLVRDNGYISEGRSQPKVFFPSSRRSDGRLT